MINYYHHYQYQSWKLRDLVYLPVLSVASFRSAITCRKLSDACYPPNHETSRLHCVSPPSNPLLATDSTNGKAQLCRCYLVLTRRSTCSIAQCLFSLLLFFLFVQKKPPRSFLLFFFLRRRETVRVSP